MKKNIVFLILVLSFVGYAGAAKRRRVVKTTPNAESKTSAKLDDVAQPKKSARSEAFQAWLKEMKKRIQRTTTKSHQVVAVAAVRGDETPDAPPLYWKGKKAEGNVDPTEVREFDAAVDSALNGNSVEAKNKLQSFMSAYPKSSMAADVQETLNRLDASSVNP